MRGRVKSLIRRIQSATLRSSHAEVRLGPLVMPSAYQDHARVDPVIKLLRDWAEEQGLTNEELAARIGVSRPSVVGWLTHLRDHELSRAPSKVSRRFSYLAQPAAVQAKIAAALAL